MKIYYYFNNLNNTVVKLLFSMKMLVDKYACMLVCFGKLP